MKTLLPGVYSFKTSRNLAVNCLLRGAFSYLKKLGYFRGLLLSQGLTCEQPVVFGFRSALSSGLHVGFHASTP